MIGVLALMTLQNPDLSSICAEAVKRTIVDITETKVGPQQVSASVYILDRSAKSWKKGGYRDQEPMYPASVVKVFWLAYLAKQVEEGKVQLSAESQRACQDMIRDSNNDATGYVVNLSTGANPGPELSGKTYEAWFAKRNGANVWFKSLGYEKINVLNRTYNEGPYGVERQAVGEKYDRRNLLTTDATARLMAEIHLDKIVSPRQCEWMRSLLSRAVPADSAEADGQSKGYTGSLLQKGSKLWSKAGWTSETRHDAATIQLPDGREVVVVVFTQFGNVGRVQRMVSYHILQQLGAAVSKP